MLAKDITNFFYKIFGEINWSFLCENNNIPAEFFENFPHYLKNPEYCKALCKSKNISLEFLEQNLEKIDWAILCQNNSIPLAFFKKHIDKISWLDIISNNNLPNSFFEENLDKIKSKLCILTEFTSVKFSAMLLNDKISFDFLKKNFENSYFWRDRCKCVNITLEYLQKIELNCIDWYNLCNNKKVPLIFLEENINNIQWVYLCENESVPLSFFEKNLDKINLDKRNWESMCRNKSIPFIFFEKYLDKLNANCWSFLCENNNIPVEFFERHLDKLSCFCYYYLCSNNNIPVEFFEKHFYRIYWDRICLNDNIPFSFFEKNSHKLNVNIFRNKFESYFNNCFILENRKKFHLVLEDIKKISYYPSNVIKVLPKGGFLYREMIEKYE